MDKNIFEFPVTIYGELEKFNDVLTKARCRIFYKYGNRNGTYITDDFAEKLINTLHYVPIKGIHDGEDFTDHGENRDDGRIYGIVPESNNFSWETHLDEDGVEREYACTDVLIFNSLYKEAKDIVGKAQSMELFSPTLKYSYQVIKGMRWVVFEEGSFLGLQVLGDTVEPCFEGAAFYSLQDSITKTINKIKEYALTHQSEGGKTGMHMINFKMSDDDKFSALWSLLNTEYNEENNWAVTYGIVSVYDDYAVVRSYETGDLMRAYYTKNDEEDSLVINSMEQCFIIEVTEKEKTTIEALRGLNGDTYELVSETLTSAQENFEKVSEFNTKIEELNASVSTLVSERDNSIAEYNTTVEKLSALTEELETLKAYKLGIETEQKEAVIAEYENQLSEEVLGTYREKLSEYTVVELDKDLAYELKKSNPSAFSKNPTVAYVPKDEPKGGINEILSKYKK